MSYIIVIYIINNSYKTYENKENRIKIINDNTQSKKCKAFMLKFDFVKLAMLDMNILRREYRFKFSHFSKQKKNDTYLEKNAFIIER